MAVTSYSSGAMAAVFDRRYSGRDLNRKLAQLVKELHMDFTCVLTNLHTSSEESAQERARRGFLLTELDHAALNRRLRRVVGGGVAHRMFAITPDLREQAKRCKTTPEQLRALDVHLYLALYDFAQRSMRSQLTNPAQRR